MRHTRSVVPARSGVAALGMKEVAVAEKENAKPATDARTARRRRVEGGRQARHVVRVSPEEEGMLLRLAKAQHVSVPRLLVESAIAAEAGETVTQRKQAMAELFTLHRLLAAISNNVNQMAKATNATGELHAELRSTVAAVKRTAERIDDAIDGLRLS